MRPQAEGLHTLSLGWLMRETVLPWLAPLTSSLLIFYCLIVELLPVLGISYDSASLAYCSACAACVAARVIWWCGRMLYTGLVWGHNHIRDERYLVGTTLDDHPRHRQDKSVVPGTCEVEAEGVETPSHHAASVPLAEEAAH
jgi:hypothetical protein